LGVLVDNITYFHKQGLRLNKMAADKMFSTFRFLLQRITSRGSFAAVLRKDGGGI
jgi:hypothetical protein